MGFPNWGNVCLMLLVAVFTMTWDGPTEDEVVAGKQSRERRGASDGTVSTPESSSARV